MPIRPPNGFSSEKRLSGSINRNVIHHLSPRVKSIATQLSCHTVLSLYDEYPQRHAMLWQYFLLRIQAHHPISNVCNTEKLDAEKND